MRKTGVGGDVVYAGVWEKNYTTNLTRAYYYAGNQRIAVRNTGAIIYYLHSDHLGSASLATNASGAVVANSDTRYTPEGGIRRGGTGLPTDRRYTGQRQEAGLGAPGYGLYDTGQDGTTLIFTAGHSLIRSCRSRVIRRA